MLPDAPWYHGAARKDLTELRVGSTITQVPRLAEIFSHKPSLVSAADDGTIKHNGIARGWLYVVEDVVDKAAIEPHPRTTMHPGDEWLTRRPLRVKMLEAVALRPEEILSYNEVLELRRRAGQPNT